MMRVVALPSDSMAPDYRRHRVRVTYADGAEEEAWVAVPEMLAATEPSGNPWAVAFLPLAMTMGESLELDLPVCPALRGRLAQLQAIWCSWYPNLTRIRLTAPTASTTDAAPEAEALLFSGGVDSSHCLARFAEARAPIPELVMAWGGDVSLDYPEAFAEMRRRYGELAHEYGTRLVPVASNLRSLRWRQADWGGLSHLAFLAACGLALGHRYHALHVASSFNNRQEPWGSHAATDGLFSTAQTEVVPELDRPRIQKLEALVAHPRLLANLRVCWQEQTGRNCGRCRKCLVTMAPAALMGVLGDCRLFPPGALTTRRLARLWLPDSVPPNSDYFEGQITPIIRLARTRGRHDLADALEVARRRSLKAEAVARMVQPLRHLRGLWRVHRLVEATLEAAFGDPRQR